MSWTKLKPIVPSIRRCLNCCSLVDVAPMDMLIAVGFGDANVTKDGEEVYSEMAIGMNDDFEFKESELWTVQDAENEALKDPDHDWRITMYAPLRGRVFQRQDVGKWVLVEEDMGFA